MKIIQNIFCIAVAAMVFYSCGKKDEQGELLARHYCASCHMFPEPSLLTKKIWEKEVLPQMAFRMGVDFAKLAEISEQDRPYILKSLPDHQMVSEEQWKAITHYYIKKAPDSIELPQSEKLEEIKQFSVSALTLPNKTFPMLTLVRFDTLTQKLFIGTRHSMLYQMNSKLEPEDSFKLHSPPSSIIFEKHNYPVITCMGIMDPNEQPKGRVVAFTGKSESLLIDSLKRPVYTEKADLNNDGQDDLLVAAFGNFTGGLLAYEKSNNEYKPHVIHTLPGTRKTIVRDFNNDGLPDILALITQGDEQITLFTNQGNFKFTPQKLLRFPPVYGSSYFELHDFNNDGNLDILFTNGDNGDDSYMLKPYHGVRIFQNNGKNKFTENWFYRMYGASSAIARDFDKDGDLDIAATSFFPDFKNSPEKGFIYFENKAGKFIPSITPLANSGRWITLEAADIDHDADDDILVGALDFNNGVPDSLLKEWHKKSFALLILRNNLHSKK